MVVEECEQAAGTAVRRQLFDSDPPASASASASAASASANSGGDSSRSGLQVANVHALLRPHPVPNTHTHHATCGGLNDNPAGAAAVGGRTTRG